MINLSLSEKHFKRQRIELYLRKVFIFGILVGMKLYSVFDSLKSNFAKWQNVLACVLIFLAIISFVFCGIKNKDNIQVPYFAGFYSDIILNIEFDKNYTKQIYLTYDKEGSVELRKSNKIFYTTFESPKSSLFLAYPKEAESEIFNNISSLTVFIGEDFWSFNKNKIQKFNKAHSVVNGQDWNFLELPQEVKRVKYSNFINYKGVLNAITVSLLALFYCYKIFIVPWILLILGVFTFKENNISKYSVYLISIIFIIASIFRLNLYSELGFWWDEFYAIAVSGNPNLVWASIFTDPANPPLFFILSKLWLKLGSPAIEWARLLPVIFGVCSILTLYLLLKDKVSKSVALLTCLLTTFSIYHIAYSQEYRSYIVSVFLVPLVIYFLFRVFKSQTYFNILNFILFSSLLINNHLFGLVVVFFNFIYGVYYYLQCKSEKKYIINFVISNFIIATTFIPFAGISFVEQAVLNKAYNDWIAPISMERLELILNANFGNLYVLFGLILLCLIFIFTIFSNYKFKIFEKLEKEKTDFILYVIYLISFVFVFTIAFSFYRSLLVAYYYILIYPLILMLLAFFACLKWRYKFINFVLSLCLVCSLGSMTFNNSWKLNRAYEQLGNIAYQQALLHPEAIVVGMIDPKIYENLMPFAHNLTWQGNYNSEREVPQFSDYIDEYANYKRKFIVCVLYTELNDIDKKFLAMDKVKGDVQFIKTTAPWRDIVKVTVNGDEKE